MIFMEQVNLFKLSFIFNTILTIEQTWGKPLQKTMSRCLKVYLGMKVCQIYIKYQILRPQGCVKSNYADFL